MLYLVIVCFQRISYIDISIVKRQSETCQIIANFQIRFLFLFSGTTVEIKSTIQT